MNIYSCIVDNTKLSSLANAVQDAVNGVKLSQMIFFNNHYYIVTPGGKDIFFIGSRVTKGNGTEGIVYNVTDMAAATNKTELVMKIAKNHILHAAKNLENSNDILKRINPQGRDGLQCAPNRMLYFTNTCAYIEQKYDGDYSRYAALHS